MNRRPPKGLSAGDLFDPYEEIKRLKKELRQYKRLSLHDNLTGLYNRRKLEEDLGRYLELQERHKVYFLVAMVDINKFKNINDTFGHVEGDRILKLTAKIIKQSIRKIDKAYRLGGDEFIIILSHCRKDKVTARIRNKLAKALIKVSIGHDKLCKDILEKIDKKMYEEKRK